MTKFGNLNCFLENPKGFGLSFLFKYHQPHRGSVFLLFLGGLLIFIDIDIDILRVLCVFWCYFEVGSGCIVRK